MPLPGAVEARRISAQLEALEQQRAQGILPHENAPLRLYRVPTGGFVRVLDRNPEPISPGMLEAISAFIQKNDKKDDLEETKASPKQESEEKKTLQLQDSAASLVDAAEQDNTQNFTCNTGGNSAANEEIAVALSGTANVDGDGVEMTANSTSVDVEMTAPWGSDGIVKTPKELLGQNERASDWLSKDLAQNRVESRAVPLQEGTRIQRDAELATTIPTIDHSRLCEQWPPQLEERRRILYLPPATARRRSTAIGAGSIRQPVVYWMQNTLRVTQGNFGLEASILLSRRLAAPLVVMCLVPSSIIYPVCHATTASDAYARFSFVELYEQFARAGVPFFGITANEAVSSINEQTYTLKPNPLYELLDGFAPLAVVADAAFDAPSRNDMQRLARYLEMNRTSCPWSLLTMDSTTCCPAYQLSMKLQSTLDSDAVYANEEQFGTEYTILAQPRHGTYLFSPLPPLSKQDLPENQRRAKVLSEVLRRLCLEEVNWQVVKAVNSQSSSQMRRFSEGEGLQKLSQLLSDSTNQPAIQAELCGGGVLSLLPFIRHGTLFAGYVLKRISEAVDSSPLPSTPQERKALAMRKVMRSRAANLLGKVRDYSLYLALWTTVRNEHKELNGPNQTDIAALSTSEVLVSLKSSAPRLSSLQTYQHLLPDWAFSLIRLDNNVGGPASSASFYDPYELESARTKDMYWNEIQKSLVDNQYLHPLLVNYWAYRLLTWSVSCRAAIATIESLLSQCVLGSNCSPDTVFIVWKQLFRIGSSNNNIIRNGVGNVKTTSSAGLDELRRFQVVLESELESQPKLKLRP